MLKGHDIICISSIDWDFIWQGHQEIMSSFARNGNRVLFIENTGVRSPTFRDFPRLKKRLLNWLKSSKGFRGESEGLFVYSPLIIPFPYAATARVVNRHLLLKALKRWMAVMDFHEPVIWTFLPTPGALDIIDNISRKLLVYYCIADFDELADRPSRIAGAENELIRKCDLVFAQGLVLAEKCRRFNANVSIFPFGVNTEVFENAKQAVGAKHPLSGVKHPIIGYIGGIHRHIDFKLLRFLAERNPEWSIVLVGPVQVDISEIKGLKNIVLCGKKDFSELPSYVNSFDVCIIPYDNNPYTQTVYPTKMNEYHAMAKPVVSTAMPEVLNFNAQNNNLIYAAKNYEDFNRCVSLALQADSDGLREQRMESARKNSWKERIQQMNAAMQDALDKREKAAFNWQESFLRFYRRSRERFVKACSIILISYFILFYTPLFWFLASPLVISQPLEKSDCIVVFAGGVGESGKPGQGYEERVQYAVELYKNGFAKRMIFSSGYSYVFKEPLLMKVLAMSLGVPEQAIILEEGARSTYENILFTKAIMEKEKWAKAILISSPYHMRRVYLVARKIAPGIHAVYAPIPESRFYDKKSHGKLKKISLEQIRALLHEYCGIIYYYKKGYI